ncbi:hypothetical protein [Piscirickettsia litoralis]|uniref:hypothetical protein n=1 Tax=Piscirickettsia litoralis TaxID=1891921 RepID=UPI001F3893BC|nr:hypothetical protein [Piscirickettsia litoralis]
MKVIIPMLLAGDSEQRAAIDECCPTLLRLLAYANQLSQHGSPTTELFASFGSQSLDHDVPLAAAYASQLPIAGGWLYADPVHISADQNGLYCQGSIIEALNDDEKSYIIAGS